MRKTGMIKINPPAPETQEPEESIFAETPQPAAPPRPEGWKKLETGELKVPACGLKNLDVFEHSQRLQPKPPPIPPVPYAKPSVTAPADAHAACASALPGRGQGQAFRRTPAGAAAPARVSNARGKGGSLP